MEYITTQDLFVGELNTVLDTTCTTDSVLQEFIQEYEPKILKKILGQEFFNLLQTELSGGLSGDWEILVNGGDFTKDGVTYQFLGLKPITARFIFYWYHRNNHYEVAQTAGSMPLRKDSLVKSMAFKQQKAWNDAVDLIENCNDGLWEFLKNSTLEDYELNTYGAKIRGLQWL